MKKFLLFFLLVAAITPAFADELATTEFGYCNDSFIYIGEGLTLDTHANIGIAIRIPYTLLANYKGGRIIGFTFAAADGCKEHEINAFLRKGSLISDNIVSTTDYVSFNPFNGYKSKPSQHLFNKGWVIPDNLEEDIYIGFFTKQLARKNIIGLSCNTQTPPDNAVFIAQSYDLTVTEPYNWEDIHKIQGVQNTTPVIRAIIEVSSENNNEASQYDALSYIIDLQYAYVSGIRPGFSSLNNLTIPDFYTHNDINYPIICIQNYCCPIKNKMGKIVWLER